MKFNTITTFLVGAFFILSINLNAQDLKPEGGEFNVEVNFDPSSSFNTVIYINELRGRYFVNEKYAGRLGLFINSNTFENPITISATNGDLFVLNNEITNNRFSIAPGIEMHFEGTEKLSPYVAAEFRYGTFSTEETEEIYLGVAKDTYEQVTSVEAITTGFSMLVGADYYFNKHVYLGTELGYGYAKTVTKDEQVTNFTGPNTGTQGFERGDWSNFGLVFNSAIRLGFLF